ncbi:putative exocyst complex protein EXO70 [Venustampulla echinocandica]|uniref:Exocyst complex protein EXO70 n=1 Tax=Venustampulla echinocandica TaxID=2656787 RepID=A0A370TFD7_9HELO|nr:putative exocyst complex protein EXO70 [Venustampulla echinocandica]RDL33613.1 putative exocyst complex protein EXO70 [Venustampulla echinocandica]
MAISLGSRHAADEEARAEVEVLNSRLEKTTQLTKKIQSSLGRLESSGRSVQDAVGPLFGNTQKLQTLGTNIDAVLSAIDRIRQPSDIKSNEEEIIRKGPEEAGLAAFLSSMKRVNKALSEMQQTNLRSNQQAAADLGRLLKSGNTQLEGHFKRLLQEDSMPVEPLHYITKDKPFPVLSQDTTTRLGLMNSFIASSTRQSSISGESPIVQAYASVRGPYLTSTLQNLAFASVNTARKQTPDAVYRQGTNGMGTYARGMEGIFLAEYDNICSLFSRDEFGRVLNLTCQGAISELARTLRELNTHIKANLTTDCYLAYEIIEIMSNLSSNLDSRTGELKPSFAAALKPIRETAKWSLGELLEDTRRRISATVNIPLDAAAVPITSETMTRLQTMADFLRPISSIMISLGDGGWKSGGSSNASSDQIPSLSSFDIGADGKQIFAHYSMDTIDTLLNTLEQKAKSTLQKTKSTIGVFIANNATIVDRMIRNSDLQPLLSPRMADVERWRKTGTQMYTMAWREPSTHLLDVQYTNRGSQRPPSGSAAAIDSAAILKGLSSKDKDAIKDKFRLFNASFDDLVAKHKSLSMEREVRETLARQLQQMIEPLYGRFWDRYHEVDKGKGKYVKYDKGSISAVFLSLG